MLRETWQGATQRSERSAKRVRQTEHPQITEMMDLWVAKAIGDGILLTGEVLRRKWHVFADMAGIPKDSRLKLSSGWLESFKHRHGLTQVKRHGEAGSAKAETVAAERKRVQELIQESGYQLHDIYNMDETGLFYGYVLLQNHLQCCNKCPALLIITGPQYGARQRAI